MLGVGRRAPDHCIVLLVCGCTPVSFSAGQIRSPGRSSIPSTPTSDDLACWSAPRANAVGFTTFLPGGTSQLHFSQAASRARVPSVPSLELPPRNSQICLGRLTMLQPDLLQPEIALFLPEEGPGFACEHVGETGSQSPIPLPNQTHATLMVCRCPSPSKTQASIWTLFPNKDNPGSAIAQARLPRPQTASEPTTPALSPSKLMPPSGHYSPAKTTRFKLLGHCTSRVATARGPLNQQCLHPQKYYPRPCRAICRSFGWAVSQTRPPDSRPHEVHSFRHPNYDSP